MGLSIDQLGKAVVAAGLMPADELKSLWSALPPNERPKDAAAFAGLLVERGKINEFQSQELLSGSGTPLVLGDYVLLSKIGAGGMGQVFKAQHRHMKRLVAVKLLPAAVTKDEATVKRFQREVEAAAKLSHPNIVHANDAGVQRGVWYLVMEYVEGRDLSVLVKERGPLPVRDAVDCILQAARGLAYAHGKGVIHRDIKPANLLLDNEGTVKILDMGLARFDNSGDAADHQLTNTGAVMGTVDYMPPEQAANTHNADARSDIYALGCSLYRLLVGESMFGGQTAVEKILAHMNEAIPSLCQKRREVPAEIDRIFQKMVAKKPTDRYQKTTELVADLEAYFNPGATTAFARPTVWNENLPEQDSKLTDFLRTANGNVGTQQALKTQGAAPFENTASIVEPESATDAKQFAASLATRSPQRGTEKRGPEKRAGQAPRRNKKPPAKLIAGGLGGIAVLLAFGIWVIVRDQDGNEVARLKVPDGGNVTISPLPPGEGGRRPGEGLPAAANNSPASNSPHPSAAPPPSPGGRRVGSAPPPAVAPFDAKTARAHQDAWAKHLGTQVETTNSVGQTMILIPPGEFLMGSTDAEVEAALKAADEIKADQPTKDRIQKNERPQHKVVITKPLLMSATEVTIGQFKKFAVATGYQTEAEKAEAAAKAAPPTVEAGQPPPKPIQTYLNPGYAVTDDSPAAAITWNDATAYCKWLSEQEKRTYRLPTEAEWEYACRAGSTTQYFFGDDYNELSKYGWHKGNAGNKSHPVGTLLPNPFGLFDMHGNLYEWCGDFFDEKWYSTSPPNDPNGPSVGSTRVVRGGYWDNTASNCRSAYRYPYPPSYRHANNGFRCVSVW